MRRCKETKYSIRQMLPVCRELTFHVLNDFLNAIVIIRSTFCFILDENDGKGHKERQLQKCLLYGLIIFFISLINGLLEFIVYKQYCTVTFNWNTLCFVCWTEYYGSFEKDE